MYDGRCQPLTGAMMVVGTCLYIWSGPYARLYDPVGVGGGEGRGDGVTELRTGGDAGGRNKETHRD